MPDKLDLTSPKPAAERNDLGQLLPGQPSLNPNGRPKGSTSIRDSIRKHLEENPETMNELVTHFIKRNPSFMWSMIESPAAKELRLGNPDGSPLGESSEAVKELTKQLNAIHGGSSFGGNGVAPGAVGEEVPNQNL